MRRLTAVLVLAPAALLGACSAADDAASDASTDSFGVIAPPNDGASASDGSDGGATISATMRLAHLAPDVGPLDFCWRSSGSVAFTGPVLRPPIDAGTTEAGGGGDAGTTDAGDDATIGADASGAEAGADATTTGGDASADAANDGAPPDGGPSDAGRTPGLDFGELTADVSLPTAGTFDIALVRAGAPSCGQPLLVQSVTLDAGKLATVVVMGLAHADAGAASALSLAAFDDEPTVDPQNARIRMIHAALGAADGSGPAPPLEAAFVTGAGAVPIAAEIDPKHASAVSAADPSVDALGYATVAPVAAPASIRLRASGDAGAGRWLTPPGMGVGAGTLHTGFIVSRDAGALGIVWCGEVKTSGSPVVCNLLDAAPL